MGHLLGEFLKLMEEILELEVHFLAYLAAVLYLCLVFVKVLLSFYLIFLRYKLLLLACLISFKTLQRLCLRKRILSACSSRRATVLTNRESIASQRLLLIHAGFVVHSKFVHGVALFFCLFPKEHQGLDDRLEALVLFEQLHDHRFVLFIDFLPIPQSLIQVLVRLLKL